jgi:hypothetical protein
MVLTRTSRAISLLILFLGVLIAVAAAWPSLRLQYHQRQFVAAYRAIESQPTRWTRFVTSMGFEPVNPAQRLNFHARRLCQLGYFETRDFPVPGNSDWNAFMARAHTLFPERLWVVNLNPSRTVLTILAPTERMKEWEDLIKTIRQ